MESFPQSLVGIVAGWAFVSTFEKSRNTREGDSASAARTRRGEKERGRQREKERCAALWSSWQWLTGYVFAAKPSTLEAGRVTTTMLPPLHSGSSSFCADRRPIGLPTLRVTERKGIHFPRVRENRHPAGGGKKRSLSFERHRRRRRRFLSELSSSTRDRSEAADIARLAGVLPERWRRSPPRPPRVSLSGTPPVPHRRVRNGVNAPDSLRPSSVDPPRFFALSLLVLASSSRVSALCFTCDEMYSSRWWVLSKGRNNSEIESR